MVLTGILTINLWARVWKWKILQVWEIDFVEQFSKRDFPNVKASNVHHSFDVDDEDRHLPHFQHSYSLYVHVYRLSSKY